MKIGNCKTAKFFYLIMKIIEGVLSISNEFICAIQFISKDKDNTPSIHLGFIIVL